jgi:hypothetical protein
MELADHHTSRHPYDQMKVDDRRTTILDDIDFETSVDTPYQQGYQLQLWVYETSNSNITVAERLEKANWTIERLESL